MQDESAKGGINPVPSMPTALIFPMLTTVSGSFVVESYVQNSFLCFLDVRNLSHIDDAFVFFTSALTSLELPALTYVGGFFEVAAAAISLQLRHLLW